MRRPEPGEPGHKLRGSWPSPPLRCRGPPSLRWRPRESTFAPGRGQTPLATPRPYSTPGSPSSRSLPAGPAQPLAAPRPTARSQAQQVPRTRPPPPRPGWSGRAWFPPPAAPRPRIHVLPRHPTRPGPGSASAQATGVRGSVRCTATHPALAWVLAWPNACDRRSGPGGRSGSRSRCRPRSWRRCRVSPRGLGPRKIRTRAGWGAVESKFLYLPSAPAAGPHRPPLTPHRAPFTWAEPPTAVATLLFSTPPGKRAKREEEGGGGGAGIRPLGSGRTRGGGGEGGGGRGGGPAVLGAPPASPGEAGTSPGSRRPRTGHGGRTELPSPASPQLQEGGGGEQRRSGSESERFRSCFLCAPLSPFRLSVWGGVGSCMWRGGALAGRSAPLSAPHFPNPATSVYSSGAPAPRQPTSATTTPAPKWDRCWGRENAGARCLASRLLRGSPFVAISRAENPLGLLQKVAPGLGVEDLFFGGGWDREARGRKGEEDDERSVKGDACRTRGKNLARRGLGFCLLSSDSSVIKPSPLTLTLYPNDSLSGQRNKSSYMFTSQAITRTEGLRSLRSTLKL